jgi:NAD(P)-dependent dehydrogenase (short-subunit alcohol dehydrogenase family)
MSESLRLETRPFGIHVVLVEPGDFRTQITAKRYVAEASQNGAYLTQRSTNSSASKITTRPQHQRPSPWPAWSSALSHRNASTPTRRGSGPTNGEAKRTSAISRPAFARKRWLAKKADMDAKKSDGSHC